MSPEFTLAVVASLDGFIAQYPGHAPHEWASPEEQDVFFAEVEAADWCIMGRGTHEAALKPDRRRIVFSAQAPKSEWRNPTQVWVDPRNQTPDGLAEIVDSVRPMRSGLILGGTAVHDWFLEERRIDRVLLTIEPVQFKSGLPILSAHSGPPEAVMRSAGFQCESSRTVNSAGTSIATWRPV